MGKTIRGYEETDIRLIKEHDEYQRVSKKVWLTYKLVKVEEKDMAKDIAPKTVWEAKS